MNLYEILGRTITWTVIAFVGVYAFSATLMSLIALNGLYTPWDVIIVSAGTGGLFGGVTLLFSCLYYHSLRKTARVKE